jgi:hypothetical protein
VDAISAAAAEAGVLLQVFNIWNLIGAPYGPAAIQAVHDIRSQLHAPVFSFVGGALPQVFGMIAHPRRPYDFIWPERPDWPLVDGAEIVPYDALYATMQAAIRPFLAIMGAIREVTEGLVFHIEPPPPCEEEIKANDPGWSAFYAADDVIAPIWFRYKLWRLQSKIVSAYCSGADIAFVPHPREADDARGFLNPLFRGKPGHGNPEYGALVLRQMQTLSRSPAAQRI